MRVRSSTKLPEYTGAEPPYARLRPVEIGYSGIRRAFAARTTACTSSTVAGATAADATRSSGSPQFDEYASPYSATSSSDVNTHSGPTASRNSSSAALKSRSLTPGGVAISDLPANRGARRDDPRVELRRLVEPSREAGVGRAAIRRRDGAGRDQRVGERARPAFARGIELEREIGRGRSDDAMARRSVRARLVLGYEHDAQAVIPREALEEKERGPLGQAGDRAGPLTPTL